ncbi:CHAT domain-containing protein [Chloroflexi bacterium TSY]|nr:CHAT domain-containing protein [Chloroflexi bacterium TSY]
MSPQQLIAQLVALSDEDKQRQILQQNLSFFDGQIIDELAEKLREKFVRDLRADIAEASQTANLIRLLASLTQELRHQALALRIQAQLEMLGYGRFQQALPIYDRAVELYEILGDTVGKADVQVTRIWALAMTEKYEEAVQAGLWAGRVLVEYEKWSAVRTLYSNLAMIHNRFGMLDDALSSLESAREVYENLGSEGRQFLPTIELNRSIVLFSLGQYSKSIRANQYALQLAQEAHEAALVARCRHNLALTYQTLGHYTQALLLFEQAKENWLAEKRYQNVAQNELASTYCLLQLRRFQDVIAKCQRVRNYLSQHEVIPETMVSLLNEVQAYAGLRQYNEAHTSLVEIRQWLETTGNTYWIALVDLTKADLFYMQGKHDSAEGTALSCMSVFAESNHLLEELQALLIAARAAIAQNESHRAQSLAQTALARAESQDISILIYEGYAILGHIAQGKNDRQRAFQCFARAIDELERLQGQTMLEFRSAFLEDSHKRLLYEEMVQLCLKLNEVDLALDYVERAKSRALMTLIAHRLDLQVQARNESDEPIVVELNKLYQRRNRDSRRREQNGLNNNVYDESDAAQQRQVESRITELWHQLLIRNADYARDVSLSQVTTERPHPYLTDDVCLVEYFIIQDEIMVFIMTADSNGQRQATKYHHLPLSIKEIVKFQNALDLNWGLVLRSYPEQIVNLTANAQEILKRLYQALIAPFESELSGTSHLIIVPHGQLHYLPFHALHDGKAYLLENIQISYLPCASYLRYCTEIDPSAHGSGLLAVGYSYDGRLPFVADEISTITQHWDNRTLLEDQATLDQLLASAPQYHLLHFATHGEFRADNPLFSGLALNDGWLTTLDIFNMRINASLVTLSACYTGRSVVGGGDELLGLMRALLAAGTVSVLLSQWTVEDRSTALLMEILYRSLAGGMTKASALQTAQ